MEDQPEVPTKGLVKEINISSQARALRLLRSTDYALVMLCGSALLGFVSDLITNPTVDDYPWLILRVTMIAVFSLSLYTGLSHVGVIDAGVWQNYIVAFPTILLLCFSLLGLAWVEIREGIGSGVRVPIDQDTLAGLFMFLWIAVSALFGFISVLLLRRTGIRALGIPLVELLSHLRSQRGIKALSVKGVKRVNAPYGILLGLIGTALLIGVALIPLPRGKGNLYLVALLGWFLLARARRYFQVRADSLLSVDKRSPILFLRSFDDDEKQKFGAGEKALLDFSLEIRLSNHFTYFGPFIAIGSPKESVPQPGAARVLLADEEWQPRVISWMYEASLIIMYSGKTHWVNWELAKIIETGRVPNLILMIPEIKERSRAKRNQEISARIDHIKEVFKETRWIGSLAAFQDFQDLRAMLFDSDGSVVLIRSRPRNRDSYHLAALIAHYIILERSAKPVVVQAP